MFRGWTQRRGKKREGELHDGWNLKLQTVLKTVCVQWHETDKQRECIQVQPALLQNKKRESGFDLELMNLHRQSLVCLLSSTSHWAAAYRKLRLPETNSFLCSLMSYMKVNLLSHWFRLQFSKEPHKCLICRYPGEWLHQRQLHWWIQEAECLHCYSRATSRDIWGLLENGVGAAGCLCCHDDPPGGEVTGKKSGLYLLTQINNIYYVELCLSLPVSFRCCLVNKCNEFEEYCCFGPIWKQSLWWWFPFIR